MKNILRLRLLSCKVSVGLRAGICAVALGLVSPSVSSAADGWATQGGGTTGGSGGATVTVSSLSAFSSAATGTTPMNINVSGMINLGSTTFDIGSNKTITGVGANSGFIGNLRSKNQSNLIFQNLNFTNPSGVGEADGLTFTFTTRYMVTHCTFYQFTDGAFDQTHACDYGTISWCKFYYTSNTGHNFVVLIGHSDSNAAEDTGKLRITMHHNWFSSLCVERMPRVRFGQVHVYNNYFGAAGSNYNIGVGDKAQVLVENNYFESQAMPWKNYSSSSSNQGLIRWNSGNVFVNTSVPTWAPNSSVFTPPYSYSLDTGSNVKALVMAGAGAGATGGGTVSVAGVSVSPTTASVGVGGTTTLAATVLPSNATNKAVTWTSNNTSVATVNASGVVTGVAAGSATITVRTSDGGFTATSAITVTSGTVNVTGVTVSPTSASVAAGGTTTLTATVLPSNATNKAVTWTSSNTAIATVSSSGVVTGVAAGSATITVRTTSGGFIATSTVTVTSGGGGTTVTVPFTKDGAGTFTYVTTGTITYINSWSLQSLTVNGVDCTNIYKSSGQLPARINGAYTFQYVSSVAWGHFDIR